MRVAGPHAASTSGSCGFATTPVRSARRRLYPSTAASARIGTGLLRHRLCHGPLDPRTKGMGCRSQGRDALAWYTNTPEYSDQRDQGYTMHPISKSDLAKDGSPGISGSYFFERSHLPNEDPNSMPSGVGKSTASRGSGSGSTPRAVSPKDRTSRNSLLQSRAEEEEAAERSVQLALQSARSSTSFCSALLSARRQAALTTDVAWMRDASAPAYIPDTTAVRGLSAAAVAAAAGGLKLLGGNGAETLVWREVPARRASPCIAAGATAGGGSARSPSPSGVRESPVWQVLPKRAGSARPRTAAAATQDTKPNGSQAPSAGGGASAGASSSGPADPAERGPSTAVMPQALSGRSVPPRNTDGDAGDVYAAKTPPPTPRMSKRGIATVDPTKSMDREFTPGPSAGASDDSPAGEAARGDSAAVGGAGGTRNKSRSTMFAAVSQLASNTMKGVLGSRDEVAEGSDEASGSSTGGKDASAASVNEASDDEVSEEDETDDDEATAGASGDSSSDDRPWIASAAQLKAEEERAMLDGVSREYGAARPARDSESESSVEMSEEDYEVWGELACRDDLGPAVHADQGVLNLRIYYDGLKLNMGMSKEREMAVNPGDIIAQRYEIVELLGGATSSRVYAALDPVNNVHVCLKVIKNDKDYFDQSLNEIKLLQYANERDTQDKYGLLRMLDYFYYHEHLVLVTELLLENLYEWQTFVASSQEEATYFTLPVVQKIAKQILASTAFMHKLDLIHNDLKPENIAIVNYERAQIKLIDLGAARHTSDRLSSYVQSRSYRAPEVILGMEYGPKIDVWSIGCIVAEMLSGEVLFQNTSTVSLLARLESIMGPIPMHMLKQGRYSSRFYTRERKLYNRAEKEEGDDDDESSYLLQPKRTTLADQVPEADDGCLDFLEYLLTPNPEDRPTALEALRHSWLSVEYPSSPEE